MNLVNGLSSPRVLIDQLARAPGGYLGVRTLSGTPNESNVLKILILRNHARVEGSLRMCLWKHLKKREEFQALVKMR